MNKVKFGLSVLLLIGIAVFGILFYSAGFVQAGNNDRYWIHHEAQGNHDETWTKCMPLSAWNGHKNHTGDWLGDRCDDTTDIPVPTISSSPTAKINPDPTVPQTKVTQETNYTIVETESNTNCTDTDCCGLIATAIIKAAGIDATAQIEAAKINSNK